MKKYNKKTVLDYISGNDIDDFDIDELENNPEFMAEVVCIDKNSYNLCSEEIKLNYEFVKKVVSNYIKDYEFVKKITEPFYKHNVKNIKKDEEESEEITENNILEDQITAINILLVKSLDYLPKDKEGLRIRLKLLLFNKATEYDRINFIEELNEEEKDLMGYGFYIFIDRYGYNDIIINHLAKIYLKQILTTEMNLEETLHNRYHRFAEIEKIGTKKIILGIVSGYDTHLADFVGKNPETFEEINTILKSIKDRWFWYEEHLNEYDCSEDEESDKYFEILDEAKDLYIGFTGANLEMDEDGEIIMEEQEDQIPFRKYIIYLAKKYNIEKEMYDCLDIFHPIMNEVSVYKKLFYNEESDEDICMMKLYDDEVFNISENKSFENEYKEAVKLINERMNNIDDVRFLKEIDNVFAKALNKNKNSNDVKKKNVILNFKSNKEDE